jgi:hypothetical protein
MALPHIFTVELPLIWPVNYDAFNRAFARLDLTSKFINQVTGANFSPAVMWINFYFDDQSITTSANPTIGGWNFTIGATYDSGTNSIIITLDATANVPAYALPVWLMLNQSNGSWSIQGSNASPWNVNTYHAAITCDNGKNASPYAELNFALNPALWNYQASFNMYDLEDYNSPPPSDPAYTQNMIQGGLYKLPCFTPCVPHAIKKG